MHTGEFDEELLVQKLTTKRAGVTGLVGEAEQIRLKYGVSLTIATAAAVVETYNRGRGGRRLANWVTTIT